jgi:hypothetical protein
MIQKFRKKPVVIEAEQFVFMPAIHFNETVKIHGKEFRVLFNRGIPYIVIPTLEGQHIADNLDWIIKGVKGELYPCKPDIFELTYEPVI